MKSLWFLVLFSVTAVAATSPDVLRYETMSFPALVTEVLGGTKEEIKNATPESMALVIKKLFPEKEEASVLLSKSWGIRKAYPYCTFFGGDIGNPHWRFSVFRYIREAGRVVGQEDVTIDIYFSDSKTVSRVLWAKSLFTF